MRNNKAFTLVELITVITLIGIIGIISVPVFEGVIKKNKEKLYDRQIEYILAQARMYHTENMNQVEDVEGSENEKYICISQLLNDGYFDSKKIIDPRNEEIITGKIKILFIEKSKTYFYEYIEDETGC